MPELPEVEAARKRLEELAKGKTIRNVTTTEDPIVFSGTTAASFATSCTGKRVIEVKRKGKNFFLVLDSGPHPIFHFGMSGAARVKGEIGTVYRAPRSKTDVDVWPPKYVKALFEFEDDKGNVEEWAFCDARRLGRIKLADAKDPETVPPLSLLGADPLLAMPSVEELAPALGKRHAPIKAVLLDQNGPLCGIGNWMVDEILYQSALHPSHPSSALTAEETSVLHSNIRYVTETAVAANAESSRFPPTWLFFARWSKGKKAEEFKLPSGETSKLTFVTVGGRTSAVVDAVQKLPKGLSAKTKATKKSKMSKGKRKAYEDEEDEEASEDEAATATDEGEVGAIVDEQKSPFFKRTKTKAGDEATETTSFTLPESLVSPTKNRRAPARSKK